MKHLKRYNESDSESMQYYVDNYLSYLVDGGKYAISASKSHLSLSRKDGEYVSLESEPDLLSFMDLLASKYYLQINYTSLDIDGSKIQAGATYKMITRKPNIYFSNITIWLE